MQNEATERRSLMVRRTAVAILMAGGLLAVAVGTALGTASSGVVLDDQASGPLVDRQLDVSMEFGGRTNKSEVELKTKGNMAVAFQRIVAQPGGTFGWHTHPGPTIVTVKSGTLTLYHAEDCTDGTNFAAGTSFSNLPHEVHLARNESNSQPLVIYAVYFVPAGTTSLRIDQPSPGPECPL
jgi:quercetin dioxygenase-like cupin family protein